MSPSLNESLGHWSASEAGSLTPGNLDDLFHNRIPAIRLPGFAAASECAALREAAFANGFDYDRSVDPPIGRIGVALYSYRDKPDRDYFQAAADARGKQRRIFANSFDPITRLMARLGAVRDCGAVIASDPEYGDFFAGLIRLIHLDAGLHADFVKIDAPNSAVGDVAYQLAWNLYLTDPEEGGECMVYDRLWEPVCESEKAGDSPLYYRQELVENCARVVIHPSKGDLVMFNCRNLHEIKPCIGERLTVTSFIGCRPNGALVLWS